MRAMSSPRKQLAIIVIVLGALFVAVLALAIRGARRESCEVCITFHGAQACREAVGRDRNEAVRTATDNACAFLASGMTDSVACQNTPPDAVTCR